MKHPQLINLDAMRRLATQAPGDILTHQYGKILTRAIEALCDEVENRIEEVQNAAKAASMPKLGEAIEHRYRAHFKMANEDHPTMAFDDLAKMAENWTENDLLRLLTRVRESDRAEHIEAVNKAHFG